ncbi:hypothetical protein ACIKTA_14545, partial [Hansschlegelia beijingensis]
FYPEYGIATVNELAAPVDRPITFHITASSVMMSPLGSQSASPPRKSRRPRAIRRSRHASHVRLF